MDMLKLHHEALAETPTAYHEFLLRYRPSEAVVYGLVEGKHDPMYYQGIIEQALPQDWKVELIATGGRASTLKAMGEFDWERYPRGRICFFIDRDLTDFIGEINPYFENLYVTEKYSIENEAISFGVFLRLLSEVFGISDLEREDQEKLEPLFERNFEVFSEALCVVMAQAILWLRNKERPNLNNISIDDYFLFEDGKIELKAEFASSASRVAHSAKCAGVAASSLEVLSVAEDDFRKRSGLKNFIRGKYCIWFLLASATGVHASIEKYSSKHSSVPKVKLPIGQKNAMIVIAPRLRCPDSLRNFIQENYGKYVTSRTEFGKNDSSDKALNKGFFSSVLQKILGARG